MAKITVALTACVSGNPYQAWHGTTGENDTVHVPDDVWEDQEHGFADLDEAKAWVAALHPDTSTHVVLSVDGEPIYKEDAGGAGFEHSVDVAQPDGSITTETWWKITGDLASVHVRDDDERAADAAELAIENPGIVEVPAAPPLPVPPPPSGGEK